MPAKPKRRRSLADEICEAVKDLTADRASRTYAAQWVMVHDVEKRLGIDDHEVLAAIEQAGGRLACDADRRPALA